MLDIRSVVSNTFARAGRTESVRLQSLSACLRDVAKSPQPRLFTSVLVAHTLLSAPQLVSDQGPRSGKVLNGWIFMPSLLLSLPDRGLNLVTEIPAEQASSLPFLFAVILEHTVVDACILSLDAKHRFRFLGLDNLEVRCQP